MNIKWCCLIMWTLFVTVDCHTNISYPHLNISEITNRTAYPFLSLVLNWRSSHWCSAVIVSKYNMITNADCLPRYCASLCVYLNFVTFRDCQICSRIIHQPGFRHSDERLMIMKYNLGLIFMKTQIKFNENVNKIKFNTNVTLKNQDCVVMFYYEVKRGNITMASYNIPELHQCEFFESDYDFCAYVEVDNTTALKEDVATGAPVLCNGSLAGVATDARRHYYTEKNDLYEVRIINISDYIQWLDSYILNFSNQMSSNLYLISLMLFLLK